MHTKTRILFVIGSLDVGGTERQLVELAKGLDRERFAPSVCCLTHEGLLADELRATGVPVTVLGLPRLRSRRVMGTSRGLIRFIHLIRAESPHVVHGFLFHAYVLGAFAAWIAHVPVVVASRRSLSNFKARRPLYRLIERVANRVTNAVVANSEAVRQDVIETERLVPGRVTVIYNGVELQQSPASQDSAAARIELGIDQSALVVTVVANFIQYKGHEFFIRAWRDIHRAFPSAIALLVGDGPLRDRYQRMPDFDGTIRFLGTRRDVGNLLGLTDVLVHPSLEEGFSNALLEAMAAGKPVVATVVGGNAEAVVHEETGLMVPARDAAALAAATCRLLSDPTERARLGANGRHRVEAHFSLARMVEEYERLYEDLVERPGATAVADRLVRE